MNFTDAHVATSETARGIVLNLVRRRQPISRADLQTISGIRGDILLNSVRRI